MKGLIILSLFLLLPSCYDFKYSTPVSQFNAEEGNKIIAYQDIDIDKEKTTLILIKINDGEGNIDKLEKMMKYVKEILNKDLTHE